MEAQTEMGQGVVGNQGRETPLTKANCQKAEFFETAAWSVDSVLRHEKLPSEFVDPCAGNGVIAERMIANGYSPRAILDLHLWPHRNRALDITQANYLTQDVDLDGVAVVMNPPFSKSVEFVLHSLGAEAVLCFQRFAWWESAARRDFWDKNPPDRVYICGNRATSWRGDLTAAEREGGGATAHAWFIWRRSNWPGGERKQTTLHHIWKDEVV